MKRTKLKGGSLSGTYLMNSPGGRPFVRKEVSLTENREYGFQRWCSQLKRLQRYSVLFPDLFPRLITYGRSNSHAYFDIEYIPDSVTAHHFLATCTDKALVARLFKNLKAAMAKMHSVEIPSSKNPLLLYIREEVEQRLQDSLRSSRFKKFLKYPTLEFNGKKVPTFVSQLPKYKKLFAANYRSVSETFTHGNITLENILYQPKSGRVVFIDPYEENIIDSVLAEYSQLFQSSHSYYELYNDRKPSLDGHRIVVELPESPGLAHFDKLLTDFISDRLSRKDLMAIRMFEVSQFIRMLPFKMIMDEDKMIFFYSLASHLFHTVMEDQP